MKWPDDADPENLPKFTILNSEQSDTVVVDEIFGAYNDDEVRFTEGRSIQDFIAEIHDSDKNTDVIQEVSNPEVVHKEDASIPPEELARYLNHTAWSQVLSDSFGYEAAISFAEASDILLGKFNESLDSLSSMPRGFHVGQLDLADLSELLPPQFLMHYDYDFIYYLRSVLLQYRYRAQHGIQMYSHTVAEELILYLCFQEIEVLIDLNLCMSEEEREEYNCEPEYSTEWLYDLLGDMDIITYLYSDLYLTENHPYHFSRWKEQQFYLSSCFDKTGNES